MSNVTTHVLDTAEGVPAEGVPISLSVKKENNWAQIASGITNEDGRILDFLESKRDLEKGTYKVRFETDQYFSNTDKPSFYPYVEVVFRISDPTQHYHIPLLLSPYGYSTYRGS